MILAHLRLRRRVSLLAAGALSPRDEAETLAHLATCARCREELEALRAVVAELERDPVREAEPGIPASAMAARVLRAAEAAATAPPRRRWLVALPAAAALAAVALLAPALPWLMAPGALADVRARVFARAGALDELAPPYVIERIVRGLPASAPLDYQVVPGCGHFGFQSPFPPALAQQPGFAPAHDPPGFDRVAYQAELATELTTFLAAALAA